MLTALFAVCAAAHAQTVDYSTTFDGPTDTVDNLPQPAVYASPPTPTDPLAPQNGWTSNDQTVTGGTGGLSTQLVGDSNYVGTVGGFFGGTQAGGLGGVYRSPGSGFTPATPDVVPSATNAPTGIINLYRTFTAPVGAPSYTFSTDFVITSSNASGVGQTRDAFAFSLGNASGTLLNVNFTPAGPAGANTDDLTTTVGGVTTGTAFGVILNAQYHLTVTVTPGSGSFAGTLQGTTGPAAGFGGSLAGAGISPDSVTQAAAVWNLTDKTATAGAFQNAGANALFFDNYTVTVPEPSTYAMIALGVLALAGAMRFSRRQA